MSTAICITNLTKIFPRTSGYRDLLPFRKKQWITAVNSVNIEIREGEFFGLLGANGAGKTTLIKLLCSLVLPTSGTASVLGHDILKEEQAVKNVVGLVSSEERSFYWRLTGRENLKFFASLYHLSGIKAESQIDELLRLVGLDKDADIRFQNYSTGMRQKLAIARGLLSEPKVLFVDEPTRSLDPVSAQAVRAFLKEKTAVEKKTLILATHNLTEAEQLCDRLAIMNHGQVMALGTVKELRAIFQNHEECRLQVKYLNENSFTLIKQLDGVIECNLADKSGGESTLELKIKNRAQVLPRLLNILIGGGAEIGNCQLKELPLEEIFSYALNRGERGQN